VIDKALIIKLVKDNELKSLFGSDLASAHELLVKIIRKCCISLSVILIQLVGNTWRAMNITYWTITC
jgi:hypothetical protein